MRPLELTVSAFGSYAEENYFPLEKLGTEGLYLITGTTGAGKTTIFDAIVFALYGESSSSDNIRREANNFRSMYAKPENATYVDLVFSHADVTYHIRRNPKYLRPKLRGEGFTETAAAVELHIPGQEVITRNELVKAKIEEILGMDRKQFSQISMIAQGEFRKLLQAKTDERQSIFRSLFHTEMYQKLQYQLDSDFKKAYGDYKDLEKEIYGIYKQVRESLENINSEESVLEKWDCVSKDISNLENAAEVLQTFIEEEEGEIKLLDGKIKELEKKLTEIALKEQKIQEREQKNKEIEGEKKKYSKQKEECEKLKNQKEEKEKHQDEITELRNEALLIRNQYGDYDALDLADKEKKKNENALREKEESREALKKSHDKNIEKLEELKTESDSLKEAGESLLKEKQKKTNLEEESDKLEELIRKKKAWEKACNDAKAEKEKLDRLMEEEEKERKNLENAQNELNGLKTVEKEFVECQNQLANLDSKKTDLGKLKDEYTEYTNYSADHKEEIDLFVSLYKVYEEKKNDYDKKHQSYFMEQAGILAQELKEDEPCPVCGSLHHPSPAQLSSDAVTKEEVETAKTALEDADKKQKDASSKCEIAKERVKGAKEKLEKHTKEFFGEEEFEACMADFEAYTKKKETKLKEEIQSAKNHCKDLKEKCDRKTELTDTKIPNLVESVEKKKKEYQNQIGIHSSSQQNAKNLHADLKDKVECFFGSWAEDILAENISGKETELKNALLVVTKQIEKFQNDVNRKAELDNKLIPVLETTNDENTDKLGEYDNVISALLAKIEEQKINIQSQKDKLAYPSKEKAEKIVDEKEKKAKQFDEAIRDATNEYNEGEKFLRDSKTRLEQLEKDLKNISFYDKEEVQEDKEKSENSKQNYANQKGKMDKCCSNNKNYQEKLSNLVNNLNQVDERRRNLKDLADAANGGFAGKAKIRLETYVQTEYLDRIIKRANIRLYEMSGSQYSLKRYDSADTKEKLKGDHTLDLNVIDHHNNTVRSVNTLSGGEAFLASLSLALGLSDEIAASAHNVRVETLFVDEGFGSLDEDTLQMAIRTLQSLTEGGRLVGIISHVADLKNKIDKQIVVSKDHDGRSRAKIETAVE